MTDKVNSLLKAIRAFIVINRLENSGVDYVARLAESAKICEDESTWMLFSSLFDNNEFCKIYLNAIETSLD